MDVDETKHRRPTVSGQILEANAERSDLEITHDLKSRVRCANIHA